MSLLTEPSAAERRQAERFVGMRAEAPGREGTARAASLADLHELAARYVGRERADATFRALMRARAGPTPTSAACSPAATPRRCR